MTHLSTHYAFKLAVQHHQGGRLQEAEQMYRQVLAMQPDHVPALHNLGALALRAQRTGVAVDLIRRAVMLQPNDAKGHNNLGNALRADGKFDEAIAAFGRALALNPDYGEAHSNLGIILKEIGRIDESIAAHRRAVAINPNSADAYNNLGNALNSSDQLEDAIAALRRAIVLRPQFADAWHNLGNALAAHGQFDEAIAAYGQAIGFNPNFLTAYYKLGYLLMEKRQFDGAIAVYKKAVALDPNNAKAFFNLGHALMDKENLDEAIASYQRAVQIKPDFVTALSSLGFAYAEQGRLDEAISACRSALELKPDDSDSYTNLLFALYHHPNYDSRQILQETRRWARLQNVHVPVNQPSRDGTPGRRLKIGYLSVFFRFCADAHFILPLLENHDKNQFEVFGYSGTRQEDQLTDRLKMRCDHWFDIQRLSAAESAELIRGHGIDILVVISRPADPCMQIMANRLAPVQITWLTFASCTTGLQTVDYRISDPHLDPAEADDQVYAEKTVRLPETAWCYDALADFPAVNDLPAMANGFITFASLNRLSKINRPVVEAWAEILRAVSNSRLRLLAAPGGHRQRLLDQFRELGVDSARVEFINRQSRMEYLKQYDRIDITLDTFPFAGHTTSMDSFWMGVPVVTLMGQTAVGRTGVSQLENLKLPELIARTREEYVEIAKSLAADLPRLSELRRTRRERMEGCALMDAPRFARNVEAAYRQMWVNWCGAGGAAVPG